MHYLNPNQMKPNCFTYCKIYTKILEKNYLTSVFEKIFNVICFFSKKMNFLLTLFRKIPNKCALHLTQI
jgi:hypothetical protein